MFADKRTKSLVVSTSPSKVPRTLCTVCVVSVSLCTAQSLICNVQILTFSLRICSQMSKYILDPNGKFLFCIFYQAGSREIKMQSICFPKSPLALMSLLADLVTKRALLIYSRCEHDNPI